MIHDDGAEPKYRSLLSPNDCALVIIDHQTDFAGCFDPEALKHAQEGVRELLIAASALNIPVITSVIETNRISADVDEALSNPLGSTDSVHRSCANPWEEPAFASAMQTANKPRLILAGLSIESSVSFTALCALEEGFDVYLVGDACLGHSPLSFQTALDRLAQAGAVNIGWRQAVIEWRRNTLGVRHLKKIMRA